MHEHIRKLAAASIFIVLLISNYVQMSKVCFVLEKDSLSRTCSCRGIQPFVLNTRDKKAMKSKYTNRNKNNSRTGLSKINNLSISCQLVIPQCCFSVVYM